MTNWFASALLLCLAGVGAGLLLLIKGLSHRSGGNEPHCIECDYNLTGAGSEVCPECGTQRTAETTVYGKRHRRPWLIVPGILVGVASCLPLTLALRPDTSTPRGRAPSTLIMGTKTLIVDLIPTFQAGEAYRVVLADGYTGHHDRRMGVVRFLVQDKIQSSIQIHVTKQTIKTAALAELQAAQQLLTSQILPAYAVATQSNKPEDAQTVVPLLQQLDKHMDNLLRILQGY